MGFDLGTQALGSILCFESKHLASASPEGRYNALSMDSPTVNAHESNPVNNDRSNSKSPAGNNPYQDRVRAHFGYERRYCLVTSKPPTAFSITQSEERNVLIFLQSRMHSQRSALAVCRYRCQVSLRDREDE